MLTFFRAHLLEYRNKRKSRALKFGSHQCSKNVKKNHLRFRNNKNNWNYMLEMNYKII